MKKNYLPFFSHTCIIILFHIIIIFYQYVASFNYYRIRTFYFPFVFCAFTLSCVSVCIDILDTIAHAPLSLHPIHFYYSFSREDLI